MKFYAPFLSLLALLAGCRSVASYREEADTAAERRIASAQTLAGVAGERISVETPSDTLRRRLLVGQNLPVFDPASLGLRDLPENLYWKPGEVLRQGGESADGHVSLVGTNALEIGLQDAVRVAAANSPDFKNAKEALFSAALALDLESHAFHNTLLGAIGGAVSAARRDGTTTASHNGSLTPALSRSFENGVETDASLALGFAGMLTGERRTAWGVVADTGFSIPLLRGSGSLVRREALTQAERNLVYAVRTFEQKKRDFAVDVEREYLSLLLAMRTRMNEEENYRRVQLSTQRSQRMADASRMTQTALDRSRQSQLKAQASLSAAFRNYEAALDAFKTKLGLPPDSRVVPRQKDLEELKELATVQSGSGQASDDDLEKISDEAIAIAFKSNPTIATARDRVLDAQRHLRVAADALRAEVTIGAKASVGHAPSVDSGDGKRSDFKMDNPSGSASLTIDLPLERTSERNSYRNALLALEGAVRDYQKTEDGLKSKLRDDVRSLAQSRETLIIESRAVELAVRRVRNQDMLLESGRADMEDLLDAQGALLAAQNSLYRAITENRSAQLALQRDMGTLDVSADGVWAEKETPGFSFGLEHTPTPAENTGDGQN